MPRDGDIDGRLAHGNLLRRWIARLPGRAGGWLALMGGIALAVGSAALVRWGESPGMFGGIAGFMLAGALIAIAWEREFGGRYAIGRRLDVLRGAFEALRTPRVILSSDREIVYVNRAFRSQFPISAGGTLHDIEAHLGAEGRWLAEFERVCDSAAEGVAGQAEVSTASSEGRSRCAPRACSRTRTTSPSPASTRRGCPRLPSGSAAEARRRVRPRHGESGCAPDDGAGATPSGTAGPPRIKAITES